MYAPRPEPSRTAPQAGIRGFPPPCCTDPHRLTNAAHGFVRIEGAAQALVLTTLSKSRRPEKGPRMRPPAVRVRAALVAAAVVAALAVVTPPVLAGVTRAAGGVRTQALVADPLALVDPFIGTAAGFNVFPGPD